MSILYVVSLLILCASLLVLKSSDKRKNIIISIVYTFCIIYFYDSLMAFLLTCLNIKNSLLIFSLTYLISSSILVFINYKKYGKLKYQKYYLDKKQLATVTFIILFCIILGWIKYSGFKAVDYDVNDAAVHYKMSSTYSDYQKVFNKYQNELHNYSHSMFGYYVPCGKFMKVMPLPHYISYNIFNTFMFCLLTLCFYITCLTIKKNKKNNIITLFLVLMYSLAYPLNYILFGFGYLGPGILSINLILLTWKLIKEDEKKYYYPLLCLFNFGLFCSYYLFVPVVFLAQTLFIIYNYIKGTYSFKKLVKIGLGTLLLPTLFGFFYYIYRNSAAESASTVTNIFQIEGYSYKNLWGNFILLIPMIIYSFLRQIKNKKIDLDIFLIVLEIIYTVVTLIFTVYGKISSYYYFKSYYILWLFSYVFIFKLINNKEYKLSLIINYSFIIFLIVLSIFNIEDKMYKKNYKLGSYSLSSEIGNIYTSNVEVFNKSYELSNKGLKFIDKFPKYSKKCGIKNESSEIGYLGTYLDRMWFYAIDNVVPYVNHKNKSSNEIFGNSLDLAEFEKKDNIKCLVISNNYLKKNKQQYFINYEKYDILYQDNYGKILIKK